MTDQQVVNFIEWIVEKLPPKYDGDIRPRFTPQVVMPNEPLVWIETHKFSRFEPKFYTTKEVLDLWKQHINTSGQQEKETNSFQGQEH